MMAKVKVTMLASVNSDYVAGKSYKLPPALADEYIHKGYADGTPSREFSEQEINELKSTIQKVGY